MTPVPRIHAFVRHPGRVRLLAIDLVARRVDLDAVLRPERGRGAVAVRDARGVHRRAEPGGLVLEAAPHPEGTALAVYGEPPVALDSARAAAHGWAGLDDDPDGFTDAARAHPVVADLHRRLGTPLLSRMPRVEEAVGRAVVHQLVQAEEAHRSCMKLAASVGSAVGEGLWCWPTRGQLRAAPDWALRRCGVSRRGAHSLRATAVHTGRLEEARGHWKLLDRRIRALPGCGVWTSGKARLALGDPDAVPVGDYNLPALVGHVLAGEPVDDEGMLDLLAPFAGHRGRIVALLARGLRAGVVRRPARTAPRAALSVHRYW
jgi:3-methyladenine DNA glycosylase/8-oxoguanine DNA glycosylase